MKEKETVKTLTAWLEQHDEPTKETIQDIQEQLEMGVRRTRREQTGNNQKTGFGPKSSLQLVYALSQLLNIDNPNH